MEQNKSACFNSCADTHASLWTGSFAYLPQIRFTHGHWTQVCPYSMLYKPLPQVRNFYNGQEIPGFILTPLSQKSQELIGDYQTDGASYSFSFAQPHYGATQKKKSLLMVRKGLYSHSPRPCWFNKVGVVPTLILSLTVKYTIPISATS
ncbi:hypothetical protein GDO78_010659 [Eleutherodactylus coqui]|uniref:Uncharacterized protein n=1 Tax=Eleutherodactylus coqui TaxID=57060 RepID=A0A8J6K6E5_ELECQ|nr:hypothetical protein GDO78_010659 [Eleutherodactylus coqui]